MWKSSGNSTALARARLSPDDDVKVIFSHKPKVASSMHFGCRIVEARDGTLFLTLGERFYRMNACGAKGAQGLISPLRTAYRVRLAISFRRSRSMMRARCTSTVLGDRPSS